MKRPPAVISGAICRQTATLDRKGIKINYLQEPSRVSGADVVEARDRIAPFVEKTPLLMSEVNRAFHYLKCECLQTGGAFKLRGATNRLLQLSSQEKEAGVVAFSSGNHARGVAIAAKRLGIRATIVMPSDAPAVKIDGTRSEGAEIIFYDRRNESREEIAAALAAKSGATVVPSFDDPAIVAGQGTVGLEIMDEIGQEPFTVVVPCGGGGLAGGIALALPNARIIAVEPEGWDDMRRSLATGEIAPVGADAPVTLCDALQTPRVSPITFGIFQERGVEVVTVSDSDVEDAIRFAWSKHKLVVEPGGAAALAAVLAGKAAVQEGSVIVLSGGNVDPALHQRIVAA